MRNLAFIIFFTSVTLNFVALYWTSFSWWTLPAAILGWYIADAMSGIIHMYMDYRPCVAGLGLGKLFFYEGSRESADYITLRKSVMAKVSFFERVVFDFKNHHPRPLALGRRSFIYQTTSIMIFIFPLSVLLNIAYFSLQLPSWLLLGLNVLLTGLILTQYFHGSLHRNNNPWIINFMRQTKLLMTPKMHDIHHATLDRDFSTINGWSNPAVNVIFNYFRKRGGMNPLGLEPN